MLGLKENCAAKMLGEDRSFEIVWLVKEFFNPDGTHSHWRYHTQDGKVFDAHESAFSPLFPCVEEKDGAVLSTELDAQKQISKTLYANRDGLLKEISALKEHINQTNIEITTLRSQRIGLEKSVDELTKALEKSNAAHEKYKAENAELKKEN